MLKIAIVDDHKLFRKSLCMMISSFDGMEVAIDAENGKVLLEKLKSTDVDLILLDIQMPEMDGYDTCKILHTGYPDILILIVSQLTTRESIHKTMELGAHGYFTKNSDPDQLEFAIRSLHDNGFYFGMELGPVLREVMLWEKKNPLTTIDTGGVLTGRELEIIKMASLEYNSAEIAAKLFINTRTVESHRKRIMQKTKSKNFMGAVLYAVKHNYISLEGED